MFKKFILLICVSFVRIIFSILNSSKRARKIQYKSLPANSLQIVATGNESYIVNTSDLEIGLDTFIRKKAFDSSKIQLAVTLLPKNHKRELIVDIGANIGSIGIHAVANKLFKSAIAFEPERENFHILKANVALNNLENKFSIFNVALSENPKKNLYMELSKENYGDHRIHVSNKNGLFKEASREIVLIKNDTLNNYFQKWRSDSVLIFIDTQGYEGYVLAGGSECIDNKIPIVLEFSPYLYKRCNSRDKLIKILSNSKYTEFINLDKPFERIPLNRKNLLKLENDIGFTGAFTDILVI